MSSGRYYVITKSGRKFCVEPIAERDQKIDGHVFTNGGISGDDVKNKQLGGAIREEESIIKEGYGFRSAFTLPAGHSPNGFIESLEACETKEEEDALIAKWAIK
jgi:hypothetical protein